MIHESRVGVAAFLAKQFPDVQVASGRHDVAWQGESDLVCVWMLPYVVQPRNISLALPKMAFRYYPTTSKLPDTSFPRDQSPLEIASDAIIAAFSRETEGVGFFAENVAWHVDGVAPNDDPKIWRVDVALSAYATRETG